MPLIKSAKKQLKQSRKKRVRNFQTRDKLKEAVKTITLLVKKGDKGGKAAAEGALQKAYKMIDTAAKKNIIHKNNAANKKSLLAKLVANMEEKKKTTTQKVSPKSSKAKEVPASVAPSKEEVTEDPKQ